MADITRLKSLMAEYELDALVVTGLKNTIYLSGDLFTDEVWHESPQGLCTSLFVIALPDKSFTVGSEFGVKLNVPGLPSTLHDCEMIVEVKQRVLAEQLKKRGFQNARIGLDMGETSADTLRALEKYLPNANFVCAESLLMRLRAVRTHRKNDDGSIRSVSHTQKWGVSFRSPGTPFEGIISPPPGVRQFWAIAELR